MNRSISDYYRTIISNKNLSRREVKEALYAAIRNGDAELIRACRGKLPVEENEWNDHKGEVYPMRFALREMAHVSCIEALADIGFVLPDGPDITPFSGTCEEIVTFLMKAKNLNRKEAVREHIFSTAYYLDVFSRGYSYYRIPFHLNPEDIFEPGFYDYLNSWIIDFAMLCKKENEDGTGDDNPFYNLGTVIRVCAQEEELLNALKAFIDKGITSQHDIGWLMSHAIWSDNEKAFDLLLKIASRKDIENINMYPRKSMKLLNRLFDMNVLIPGSDKAFDAFEYLFHWRDYDGLDEDILKATMHPSYVEKEGFLPNLAVVQRPIPVGYYPIFAPTKAAMNARNDKGRTILYYYATRYPDCIEELLQAGAVPYDVDGEGNSVLHVMIRDGNNDVYMSDFKEVAKFLPENIICSKNNEGKTPLDLFTELLTKKNGAE